MTPGQERESAYTPEECREMLRDEIDGKVSSKALSWAVGITVVVALGMATLVYTAYSSGQDAQNKERKRIAQLQQGMLQDKAAQTVKLENIEADISEIKETMKTNAKTASQVLEMMREQRNMRIEFEERIMRKIEELDINGD